METKIICAGFGGQGVMSMGRLIAYTGMKNGKEVSWLPSYGPEMRGGTANCHVIVADKPIASPVVSGNADAVIAMNLPSMRKFETELAGAGEGAEEAGVARAAAQAPGATPPGAAVQAGVLLYNSSLIEEQPDRNDVILLPIPATSVAGALGNTKIANMVMLGAFLAATSLFSRDQVIDSLKQVFGTAKDQFLPLNIDALDKGFALVDKDHLHAVATDPEQRPTRTEKHTV
ncbi:MAG: 2-oxoacid:acceptor oxidoreductase family protein [bacterium]